MGTLTMVGDIAEVKDWTLSIGWNLLNQCQHPHICFVFSDYFLKQNNRTHQKFNLWQFGYLLIKEIEILTTFPLHSYVVKQLY